MKTAATLAGFVAFILVATANGAGYRFGVSDEAAYVPAVMLARNPAAFPHDASLLNTQGQFFIFDNAMGSVARATGASIESLFLLAYLIAIAAVWAGVLLIGSKLYQPRWLTVAFAAVVTIRHHIPRTSVNAIEPYFQSRVLAFGIGMIAIAAFLRGRQWLAVALVAAAALCHATTALWFAVLIGTALMVIDRRWRIVGSGVTAAGLLLLLWAIVSGPTMDALWIEALGGRDFIFATEWPLWAWMANLGLLAVLWMAQTVRRRQGTATELDAALTWGATALVALFVVTLPAVAVHRALAVQFQFSRVFWIVDLLVAMYGIAALGESVPTAALPSVALIALLLAVARGGFVMLQEHQERPLFQVSLPESPWLDAMRWVGRQPINAYVLADPGHSYKYGASVRVAAGRDVLLEDDKDSAIAMYSRPIAERIVDRRRAIGDFSALTVARAHELAEEYGLNYLVTEAALSLPEVYRNSQFRIYALKPVGPAS